jgi:broad specificity phosphatase PhoE
MNKSVLLVRHGRMAVPFDNYDRLDYGQLNQLSLRKVDPSIDRAMAIADLELLKKKSDLGPFEVIMVSESRRTRETARIIDRDLPIVRTSYLNEILFDLSQLVPEQRFRQEGMASVRLALFTALLDGSNVEKLENVFRRLEGLDQLIRESEFQSIMCVTHGFLMRFLQLYFLKSHEWPQNVTIQNLLEVKNPDYMEGIEVPNW